MSIGKVILNEIQRNPRAWEVDQFWAKHRSGTCIWMGNGVMGCHIERPEYQEFGFFDRRKIYQTLRALQKESSPD